MNRARADCNHSSKRHQKSTTYTWLYDDKWWWYVEQKKWNEMKIKIITIKKSVFVCEHHYSHHHHLWMVAMRMHIKIEQFLFVSLTHIHTHICIENCTHLRWDIIYLKWNEKKNVEKFLMNEAKKTWKFFHTEIFMDHEIFKKKC
jgi:hypothetical protein